ncbi:MAG: hypothetical protein A3F54_03140 [Candidatus Kerfeldbacteria bacterium RIFCSPHIGHO2_12_FULL_48_17]|uniref:Response regulatory domain-containing protein n=1 Tax=Candidatus Kerfeldbacteria bacterium RIFCSPHIGHO2_12_FULL_48_17 TaxID=1798542 RepID=A0A1G2B6C3_9BACT|nr:MAG: hypothetical protein A3F54_03140 [Candidatus Kerfeldbacteria bacterium RIFCSPHIGHO2_12_FULL_48_17]
MKDNPDVLLVEDDPDQILLYSTKFELEDLRTIGARRGKDALVVAKSQQPKIILLDLVMPDMDGIEVLRQLKKNKKTRDIPVWIFSNLTKDSTIAQAKKLGAKEYIVKAQIDPNKLVEKIKSMLK